ncbi:DUF6907 domain-containing protein [Streptomyces lavendulocolor]|uniref:DUF6907 domain-containing protein n=1 Tax=Streptomyces lavendulocolor TaxID=67316 RepID=UPI0033C7A560
MTITIPENVKPSGGLVVPFLSSIPTQPSAAPVETLPNKPLRLVPALVGSLERRLTVYIECPEWCMVDHTREPAGAVEDVMHYGDTESADISTLLDDNTLHSALMAGLCIDPSSTDPRLRQAHILVSNENNPEDARLTPKMAEELADDLADLATHLRDLAQIARQTHAAEVQA